MYTNFFILFLPLFVLTVRGGRSIRNSSGGTILKGREYSREDDPGGVKAVGDTGEGQIRHLLACPDRSYLHLLVDRR